MTASVSMVTFNKLVMHQFPYPNMLLLTQNTITIILNFAGTSVGIFEMKPWQMDHFKIWALPTMTFSIMLLTSLKALPLVAVATTVVFRNIGTVIVAFGDAAFFGKEFNFDMKVAIGVILLGSIVYGAFDLDFDYTGYMWMTANTLIFACNVLYEKYAVVSVDQTAVGISCYQNILSLPLLLVMIFASGGTEEAGEWTNSLTGFGELPGYMQAIIPITGVFGCLLSICYMSLNQFASPTSITIASNLNKLVSAIVGGMVFHNTITAHTVIGLLICMAGGYMYGTASRKQPDKSAEKNADKSADEEAPLTAIIDAVAAAVDGDDDADEDKEM